MKIMMKYYFFLLRVQLFSYSVTQLFSYSKKCIFAAIKSWKNAAKIGI